MDATKLVLRLRSRASNPDNMQAMHIARHLLRLFASESRVQPVLTALGEGAVSISFAAVALARKIFGRLSGRHVLVVGAGEISTLTAQHLRSHGVGDIVIVSRTASNAEALAAAVEGQAVPWSELAASLDPYVRDKYLELWHAAQGGGVDEGMLRLLTNATNRGVTPQKRHRRSEAR